MLGKTCSKLVIHQLRLMPFGGGEKVARKPVRARRAAPRNRCTAFCGQLHGEIADFIGRWAEVPSPLLVADEADRLPKGTFEELRRLGLIVPGGTSVAVGCEACELDHAEWVEAVVDPDGGERFFIDCPEKGRVEVSRRRLQHWAVDFTPLARALKEGLRAFGSLEVVHPGRLWRLGKASLAGRVRDLWMARQLCSVRSPAIGDSILRPGDAVIFTLGRLPAESLGEMEAAALLDVRRVAHIGTAGFRVDRQAVERRLRSGPAAGAENETQLLCCCG